MGMKCLLIFMLMVTGINVFHQVLHVKNIVINLVAVIVVVISYGTMTRYRRLYRLGSLLWLSFAAKIKGQQDQEKKDKKQV